MTNHHELQMGMMVSHVLLDPVYRDGKHRIHTKLSGNFMEK